MKSRDDLLEDLSKKLKMAEARASRLEETLARQTAMLRGISDEVETTELRKRALALYKPPFRFERGYVFDSNNEMVADNPAEEEGAVLRVRGWGRISYMKDPEQLQDEVGSVIAEALDAYWRDRGSKDGASGPSGGGS